MYIYNNSTVSFEYLKISAQNYFVEIFEYLCTILASMVQIIFRFSFAFWNHKSMFETFEFSAVSFRFPCRCLKCRPYSAAWYQGPWPGYRHLQQVSQPSWETPVELTSKISGKRELHFHCQGQLEKKKLTLRTIKGKR